MRALGLGRNQLQIGGADDVDPAVTPVVEAEDFLARDDSMLDDPVERAADLQLVPPKPKRAHQGWRYLEEDDAPTGESDGTGLSDLPPRLYGKLAALALV